MLRAKGNGVTALHEVHRWCTQQSAAGLMARSDKLDNPDRAKNEEEVYQKVMAWVEEHDEIARLDPSLEMNDRYEILAVQKILSER